jgi:hypothetical protein
VRRFLAVPEPICSAEGAGPPGGSPSVRRRRAPRRDRRASYSAVSVRRAPRNRGRGVPLAGGRPKRFGGAISAGRRKDGFRRRTPAASPGNARRRMGHRDPRQCRIAAANANNPSTAGGINQTTVWLAAAAHNSGGPRTLGRRLEPIPGASLTRRRLTRRPRTPRPSGRPSARRSWAGPVPLHEYLRRILMGTCGDLTAASLGSCISDVVPL